MSKAGCLQLRIELPDDWDDPEDLPHILEPVPCDGIFKHPKVHGRALRKFRKYFTVDHPGTERLLNKILEEDKK